MMTPEERTILLDMAAYIIWCVKNNNGFYSVLGNIGHDCIGLLNHSECFLPRTTDYQKTLDQDLLALVRG